MFYLFNLLGKNDPSHLSLTLKEIQGTQAASTRLTAAMLRSREMPHILPEEQIMCQNDITKVAVLSRAVRSMSVDTRSLVLMKFLIAEHTMIYMLSC